MNTFLALALVLFLAIPLTGCGQGGSAGIENGALRLPLAEVDDGQAHYYTVKVDGRDVRLFVIKSPDGVIRAALDACDVCYREKKGYRQDGQYMVCQNCSMRFHVTKINEVKGGCNPAPLERVVDGDKLVISEDQLRQGIKFF